MDGRLIRLYPVPFRYLDPDQKFKKYAWIRARLAERPPHKDNRPDSYSADQASIEVIQPPSSPPDWTARRSAILPLLSRSMEEIAARREANGTSLGIFKPRRVDMEVRPASKQWSPSQRQALMQSRLWEGKPKKLEKIPYEFRYVYHCADPACSGHRQLVTDWELGTAFLKWRGDGEHRTIEKIRERWGDWMWVERDSYLIVGTTRQFGTWIVIGVFYPPAAGQGQSYLSWDSPGEEDD